MPGADERYARPSDVSSAPSAKQRRLVFWIALVAISVASAVLGLRLFPDAFPILQLELRMDREAALAAARDLMSRHGLGPANYRQAASFASDPQAQTFVELEGGGKEAFTRMLREGTYASYTWRVRHFREGEKHETLIRFRPDGQPYGFVEQIEESAAGAALSAEQARVIAEAGARDGWHIDLQPFALVEQSQERRPGGRVDHALTYERSNAMLNEGRYRLRLVVSGDRLTEATHFIRIPEAFTRRYEEMRSANEAIGAAGAIAMVVLYVIGGVGFGLFWLLRHRWVLTRQAMTWGIVVALFQVLATLNDWPLLWMSYDTAVPRASFIGQQIVNLAVAFIGFTGFFGLSFMAAESLTRRAFGHHPQLWRLWSPRAATSTTVLGQTVAGFLLVTIFFAYDVLLYYYATRLLGWWAPSEALIHPDILASYFPWLSAIANSLQAGFWEESLFRAVPIAGAALIGDRYGKRGLFIGIAFVIQAIVFGAGHAPYPTQPSYSRPVELILPSIAFGLLYLRFGLLVGIILHYAFDVVWFALPLFVSTASGIWIDRLMIILLTLVPLWVVLAARVRTGAWHTLPADLRNAAWTPPAPLASPTRADDEPRTVPALTPRFVRAWTIVGIAALGVWLAVEQFRTPAPALAVSRAEAARLAREAITARGTTVDTDWRVMPVPESGRDEAHRFVWEAGGTERYLALLGRYLPTPRWRVRVATFEGDVADRAEEWIVLVNHAGEVDRLAHRLPESRAAPSLAETDARRLAIAAIEESLQLPPSALREVSADPSKLVARTDWTFTFQDLTVEPIPMRAPQQPTSPEPGDIAAPAEARIDVEIAGTEIVRIRPFLRVPEAWQRDERGRETLSRIVRLLSTGTAASALVAAAILGIVAWSRRQFPARIAVAMFGLFACVAAIAAGNAWPTVMASLSTAQPFGLQVLMRAGLGMVGLLLTAAVIALAAGTLPRKMPRRRAISSRTAAVLGISLGLVAVAATAVPRLAGEPAWPDVSSLGTYLPVLAAATAKIPGFLLRTVTLLVVLAAVDGFTRGWTTHRAVSGVVLIVAGAVLGSTLSPMTTTEWATAAVLSGIALFFAYVFLLRHDLTLTPIAMATSNALAHVRDAVIDPSIANVTGSLIGAALTALIAWWMFRTLRRARESTLPTQEMQPVNEQLTESVS